VEGLDTALAVHGDVGRCIRHFVVCAEMVNPPLDAEPIREVSRGVVEGGEVLGFGRVVLSQLPHNEKAVADDFERPPITNERNRFSSA
jgi:hypothetical protein